MPGSTLLAPVSLPPNGILHLVPLGLVKVGNTKLHPSKTCTVVRNPYPSVVVFVSLAAHCPLDGWLMTMRASKLVLSNSFGSARILSYMRRMSKIPTHLSTARVSIQSAAFEDSFFSHRVSDVHQGIYSIFQRNLTTGATQTLVDAYPGGASRPELSHDRRTLAFVRRVRDQEALVLKYLLSCLLLHIPNLPIGIFTPGLCTMFGLDLLMI